jgi:ribosomal protein S18 acetylase RimI-like enzyme
MSQPSTKVRSVKKVPNEDGVERVNAFFNSKAIKQELHRFTYSTTLERAFKRDDRRLFYVEDDGEIVGVLMVWCESQVLEPNEAQIRLVAVANEYRDRGIGKRLCEEAESFASEYGEEKISADVASDSPALAFWKACGYEVDHTWGTDNGREMSRMMKSI